MQIWVALILVPVNVASLLFVTRPGGLLIAALAVGGMLPNIAIMFAERGLSKLMALPHVLIWTPLVIIIALTMSDCMGCERGYVNFLLLLLITDLVSLAFDFPDLWKWWKGDRAIAGSK